MAKKKVKPKFPSVKPARQSTGVTQRNIVECNEWGKLADLSSNSRFKLKVVRIKSYQSGGLPCLGFYSTHPDLYNEQVVHTNNDVWIRRDESMGRSAEVYEGLKGALIAKEIFPEMDEAVDLDFPIYLEGTKLVSSKHIAYYINQKII